LNDRLVRWLQRTTRIPPLGLGILICAVAAPLVAQRAAHWSTQASGVDQNALQNQALREEHFSRDLASVNQDVRTFGIFAEYENDSLLLTAQATKLQGRSPPLALRLLREASLERSLAAGQRQGLQTTGYVSGSQPTFDFKRGLAFTTAGDPELQRAQSGADQRASHSDHDKATNYTGIATLWAAGLFFFTLAQVARAATRPRHVFAFSGVIVVLGAVMLTLLVWL
jgi:hypothetical protein